MKPDITERLSTHFDERSGGQSPSMLVIHYTDTRDLAEAEDFFLGRVAHPSGGRVSAHYMIDMDGTTIRYVAEDKRAWHAGVSYWQGDRDINSCAIGIELVNPGMKYGYRPFPDRQIKALCALVTDIFRRHAIPPTRVLGHSDVAPDRKTDPGALFDWQALAHAGIGLWPDPNQDDFDQGAIYAADPVQAQAALTALGYDPEASYAHLLRAFHCHYQPARAAEKTLDHQGAARLQWLLRHQ